MSNTYPDDVCFLLANDSIQEAETNKITLIGFYAVDNILIKDKKPGKAVGQIVILVKFRGGSGTYKGRLRILSPSQDSILDSKGEVFEKEEDKNMLIGIKISPFLVKEFGDYKCIINLDDKEYTYDFKVGTSE